ncbi:metallophosphoesterase family protein [Blastococcus saxobsidens]|uniref:Calcineurin-like phosphoesterase family protein n=1 Tax=Blastococcus saxobsidens TaxID=138336 RepID=A0A4Q7YAJ4_9ACTN|nr:metallophosphoesterase [Blastococcus saxobsidens]RZU33423.1 calcineurin-like phosphoesterase family protein [Blastococcus saxobsidens]
MTEPSPRRSPWPGHARRAGRWAARIGLALGGALVAVLLFARTDAAIGPFDASLAFRPAGGGAQVSVPPLGALAVDVYDGPLRLDVALQRVDQDRAQALASDPVKLAGVVDRVTEDLQGAVVRLVWLTAFWALAGGALTSWAVLHRRREPLIALGLTTAVLAGTGTVAAATWRPEALSQPTYTGLLVNANSLIGSAEDIVARFDAYRASLEDLVSNVGTLYATLSALPAPSETDTVALLHVSDIHLNPAGFDLMEQVAEKFAVDGVLDTGDITDWGSEPENRLLPSVSDLEVPYVFIRGNHDSAVTAALLAAQPNVTVLDDSDVTVAGIRIVGTPDPRFTPDKSTGDDDAGPEVLIESGEELAEVAADLDTPAAVALVHDPKQAPPLDGIVPLVLAGHTHDRDVSVLDGGTRLMVQGSTGGAGLRALQGEYPEPLTCTVLYLDPDTGALRAYDEITLGGLGQTDVTVQRTLLPVAAGGGSAEGEDTTDGSVPQDGVPQEGVGTTGLPSAPSSPPG